MTTLIRTLRDTCLILVVAKDSSFFSEFEYKTRFWNKKKNMYLEFGDQQCFQFPVSLSFLHDVIDH